MTVPGPPSGVGRVRAFFTELSRRRVYRVTAIYVVLAIGALELASVLLPATRLPEWFDELFLGLAIVGLPLVLVLAWTFDITEAGIERTPDSDASRTTPPDPDTPAQPEVGEPSTAPRALVDAGETELDPLAVAVLPFENLSGAGEAEPFALGLHDDLLTELSRASALTVISRTSVKGYRGSDKSVRQIARELGAGTIVEGGVQQSGNRIRLNVQLIDARSDGHRWAERYDHELTAANIFDIQSELAGKIMAELHARLTTEEEALEQARPTGDLEAYQFFATGRQALIDRSEKGFLAAAALFEQAIERDPSYALAWAGLGDALVGLVDYGHVSSGSGDMLKRGEDACRKALELDPNLAEAHSSWGRLRSAVRDAPGAARAHRRASELRPSYAGAHQWTCWAHLLLNEGPAALSAGRRATRLDPFDLEASGNVSLSYLMVGDPESALAEARRILRRHPAFEYALWAEGLSLHALGRWGEGMRSLGRLRDRWTRGWPELSRCLDHGGEGEEESLRSTLAQLREGDVPFKAGLVHLLLGETEEAFEAMRKGWPLPWDEALYLYVHREQPLTGVREAPRFAALVDDVVESWRARDV